MLHGGKAVLEPQKMLTPYERRAQKAMSLSEVSDVGNNLLCLYWKDIFPDEGFFILMYTCRCELCTHRQP